MLWVIVIRRCVCACGCTLSMRVLMVGVLHDCRNFLGIYTWDWIVALLVIGACEGICFIFICAVLMWRIRVGTSYFLSGLVHFLGESTSYAVWEPFPISPENPVGNTIGFWEQNENECCKGMRSKRVRTKETLHIYLYDDKLNQITIIPWFCIISWNLHQSKIHGAYLERIHGLRRFYVPLSRWYVASEKSYS